MHPEELKSKANRLLTDAESIRIVLEGFKGNYRQTIMPDLRRSVVNDVEISEQEIMKKVEEEYEIMGPRLDSGGEEVWVALRLVGQPLAPWFVATTESRDDVEDLKKMGSETTHLRPEDFQTKVSILNKRILEGEFDDALSEEPRFLMYRILTGVK